MRFSHKRSMSRRGLCLCCVGGAAYAATGGWLTPREAFAEARGLVSMFKDNAAIASIATHKLPNNISVLEGSGGNIDLYARQWRQLAALSHPAELTPQAT